MVLSRCLFHLYSVFFPGSLILNNNLAQNMMPVGPGPLNGQPVSNGDSSRPQMPQFAPQSFNAQQSQQFMQQNVPGAFSSMSVTKNPQDPTGVPQNYQQSAQQPFIPARPNFPQPPALQRPALPSFVRPGSSQVSSFQRIGQNW